MDINAEKIIKLAKFSPTEDRGLLYVLLPEGGLDYFSKNKIAKLIQSSIPTSGYLIGGGNRIDYNRRLLFNSVVIIDHAGKVLDAYDKTHLVPFGEYIPLIKYLPITMRAIVLTFSNNFIGFSPGVGSRTLLRNTEFPFNPLICYESLFSRDVIKKSSSSNEKLPKLLINFTTDMWYKDSSGPYQHFDMTALRAIEFGTPLIRTAGTGISGIVDPYGRIIAKLPLNKEGVISSYIPFALENKTLYSIYRDIPVLILLSMILLGSYVAFNFKFTRN